MSNMELVAAELEAAKKKHPKFIDYFVRDMGLEWFREQLANARMCRHGASSDHRCDFHHVLVEEGYEAFVAYAEGDLAHAKQELAQCAAVCIRGMEWIDEEMKERETAK